MESQDVPVVEELTTSSGIDDGSLAVDLLDQMYRGFCMPGDYLVSIAPHYAPSLGQWMETPIETGSLLSAILAAAIWLSAILITVRVYRLVHDAYVTVMGYAAQSRDALLRTGRNGRRRAQIAARNSRLGRHARVDPTLSEEVELGELDYAVLRCHEGLPRGRGLTADDIAETLGLRISQIRRALDTLLMLQLIDVASRPRGREGTYRLTHHGEGFLTACTTVAAGPLR